MNLQEREKKYPARYYAIYDPTIKKPVQIRGWMDVWDMGYSEDAIPDSKNLYPLSKVQWDWHFQQGNSQAQINENGSVTRYVSPPALPLSIKQQAQNALDEIQDEAPMVVAMGETFGPKTRQYVRELNRIINSDNPTDKELPVKPDNLTD